MIHVETKSGFVCDIPEENLDNMELLEELVKWQRGDRLACIPVIQHLLGEECKKSLYDYCRDEKGRVRASRVTAEAMEIIAIVDESGAGKNS